MSRDIPREYGRRLLDLCDFYKGKENAQTYTIIQLFSRIDMNCFYAADVYVAKQIHPVIQFVKAVSLLT